jgi:pilus assembly protein CpaB
MNKRFLSVLLFAVVVAGLASLILYRQIAGNVGSQEETTTQQILVASRDLPIGTLIRDSDVRMASWSGEIPPGALLTSEEAVNRGVLSNIYSGEAIVTSRLAAEGAGGGLAATIPQGKRAVAVKVDQVIGVAGFVVPGMRVDVVIAGNPGGRSAGNLGTLSKTLLQNIEVLSAGQNIQRDEEGKPIQVQVVNLLVTPEQAEKLTLATREAQIQLVLRNPLDQEEVSTDGAALSNLFSGARPKAPAPRRTMPSPPPRPREPMVVAPPPSTIEVIHGVEKTEAQFDSSMGGN